jgi:hypothetical protein
MTNDKKNYLRERGTDGIIILKWLLEKKKRRM